MVKENKNPYGVSLIDLEFESICEGHPESAYAHGGLPLKPEPYFDIFSNAYHAAYAFAPIKKALEEGEPELYIRAAFSYDTNSAKPENFAIKVSATSTGDPTCGEKQNLGGEASSKTILGLPEPTNVIFDYAGRSVECKQHQVTFKLNRPRLTDPHFEARVGYFDIRWHWKYQVFDWKSGEKREPYDGSFGKEHEIGFTDIRVFLMLDVPNHPWTTARLFGKPRLTQSLPWVDALELACHWACGAKDQHGAAERIVNSLNQCDYFSYASDSSYCRQQGIDLEFIVEKQAGGIEGKLSKNLMCLNLSQFLAEYRSMDIRIVQVIEEDENKYKINCEDCAHIVLALSNLLGCNLWAGRLQGTPSMALKSTLADTYNAFFINKGDIKLIGKSPDKTNNSFGFHCVAWAMPESSEPSERKVRSSDFATDSVLVYDACLGFKVAGEQQNESQDDPTSIVPKYQCAVGMPFLGQNKSEVKGYQSKLATSGPGGRDKCIPQPATVLSLVVY